MIQNCEQFNFIIKSNPKILGPTKTRTHQSRTKRHQWNKDGVPWKVFEKKRRINFRDPTSSPCSMPNVNPEPKKLIVEENIFQKLERWLQFSPFRIWISKFGDNDPYAQCIYSHCHNGFRFYSIPTFSYIVEHFKTKHKPDYTKFYVKLYSRQNGLSSFKNVISVNQKPFKLCLDLLVFSTHSVRQ